MQFFGESSFVSANTKFVTIHDAVFKSPKVLCFRFLRNFLEAVRQILLMETTVVRNFFFFENRVSITLLPNRYSLIKIRLLNIDTKFLPAFFLLLHHR